MIKKIIAFFLNEDNKKTRFFYNPVTANTKPKIPNIIEIIQYLITICGVSHPIASK